MFKIPQSYCNEGENISKVTEGSILYFLHKKIVGFVRWYLKYSNGFCTELKYQI